FKPEGKSEIKYYKTGAINDPELVDRLHKEKVKFTKIIPKENSPLLNFFLTWVLPFLIFIAIGQWLMRKLQGKMMGGGNALSFGKSNAKVYVEAQTGITFKDVAGQDEAKEALQEIVDFLDNPKKYKEIG
ncbi:cell division protein FtsH, partial [Alkalihalophilus lindianensis]|nr:cell division protein FtsH [Alkalihalophilus lindianensis]